MTSLYLLTDQLRELQALAESDTDIPDEVLRDTLEGLQGELQIKATNVAMFVRNQEALADAIDAAAKTMKERAARVRRRADSVTAYLLGNMMAAGVTRIESPQLVLAVKKNPPAVIVESVDTIPAAYFDTDPPPPPPPPKLNKKRVADAIKGGTDVPGCRLEQGHRLEIKA